MKFKQTAFCLFTNKKRQARANSSENAFIVSRRVDLKLSFQPGRKATKMDANLSLLSPRTHMCECTACVCVCAHRRRIMQGNATQPAPPAGLPTHHKEKVGKKSPSNYASLRSAPPSHFCSPRRAI